MFRKKKVELPKQWFTPGGLISNLYRDMLEQPHIYFLGHQTTDRDLVRDGLINTALFQAPTTMQLYLVDLCGTYMVAYRNLPHTMAYVYDELETLDLLNGIYSLVVERLKLLAVDNSKTFPAVWVIIDGFEGLCFNYKKRVEYVIPLILSKGKIANVHLALFSSYTKATGGIDELFPAYGIFNGAEITTAKLRRITQRKIATAPKVIIYKNIDGLCDLVAIPSITDEEIKERVNWWQNQLGDAYYEKEKRR